METREIHANTHISVVLCYFALVIRTPPPALEIHQSVASSLGINSYVYNVHRECIYFCKAALGQRPLLKALCG